MGRKSKGCKAKEVTLAQPPVRSAVQQPMIRDTGAAPLKLVGVLGQGTEFRRIADGVPVVIHSKGTRVVADPLDYYLHRRVIDGDQFSAGERLRKQHYHAFGSGYHSVNLDGFHGTTNYSDNWRITTSQGDSLREYTRTLGLFTAAQREMIESVCCRSEYAKQVARRCGVHPRRGIVLLRDCLTALSAYYRTGIKPAHAEAPTIAGGGLLF
jgi:hypothetical protein